MQRFVSITAILLSSASGWIDRSGHMDPPRPTVDAHEIVITATWVCDPPRDLVQDSGTVRACHWE